MTRRSGNRIVHAVTAVLFCASGARIPAQATRDVVIVGVATTVEDATPLAYVDVTLSQNGKTLAETFGTVSGIFRLTSSARGAATLKVRRLGYKQVSIELTLGTAASDTLRLRLTRLSIDLERVKVTAPLCPGRDMGQADTAVLAIFQQVMQNAERNRLLLRSYPFSMKVERTIADELGHPDRPEAVVARKVIQVDTLELPGEHAWRYAPGNLVLPGEGSAQGRMMLPQLVDFADDAFVAAHCFRYAGTEKQDGRLLFRVDFQPTKDVLDDVRGSLWFSAVTYQLQRSTLLYEMPAPPPSTASTWVFHVETRFRELIPFIPIIDRVSSQTTVRARSSTYGSRQTPRRATEEQELLSIRYVGRRPDADP